MIIIWGKDKNIETLKSWQRIAHCNFCDTKFITTKYKLEQNTKGVFCSRQCYASYKSATMKGENNPRYVQKVQVTCDNCGKVFERIPSLVNNLNSFGDMHHFCSHNCYSEFRSKYYINDKHFRTGHHLSEDTKNKLRECTVRQLSNGILSTNTNTKPQLIINNLLDDMSIRYTNEYAFKYYAVDNYLDDYNLIIEVMGDFFHANPTVYLDNQVLHDIQTKDIVRDKRKHTYIKKYYNIEILYLWETDIKYRLDVCKKIIEEYIKQNGKLNDYQSFNFFLFDGQLQLKTNKINPYFLIPRND